MKKPYGLNKVKAALHKIVRVPKVEVDRRIAEERREKREKRAKRPN